MSGKAESRQVNLERSYGPSRLFNDELVVLKKMKLSNKKPFIKNLEIGVSTKLIVTARIKGNVLLKMSFLHI